MKKFLPAVFVVLALTASAQSVDNPITPGLRYATDAYPGFDPETYAIAPARKEPKWFSWITGPKKDTVGEQYAYCLELEREENWSKAIKEYDALVRNWPTATEAPLAQFRLAELLETKEDDLEEAFEEYRYLADFYSFRCDYNRVVDKMYEVACKMRVAGKTIVFFRFKNSVTVRHSFESSVLRAPGAAWTPDAMLTIGEIREEDLQDEQAVQVYENLRNLHYGSKQANTAMIREANARMRLLRKHGYNRDRCRDTIAYLKLVSDLVAEENKSEIAALLAEAEDLIADEIYKSTLFYDSRMRTKRSAIAAYERFLKEYPNSSHAAEIRQRLEQLKGSNQ